MLGISAIIIYKFTLISNRSKFMFPAVDCPEVAKSWASMQAKSSTPNLWQSASIGEYEVNAPLFKKLKPTHYGSTLQCYCKTPENFAPHTKFTLDQNFTTSINGKTISVDACKQYKGLLITGKVFGQMIAFMIIAINIVLKTIIIKLVTWIKQDT